MIDDPRRAEENATINLEGNADIYVAIIGESQLASSSFVYMYGLAMRRCGLMTAPDNEGKRSLAGERYSSKYSLSNIYTCCNSERKFKPIVAMNRSKSV